MAWTAFQPNLFFCEAGMVRLGTGLLLSTIVATGIGSAQGPGKTDAARPVEAEIHFIDGSMVRASMLQDHVDVMTRYGKLTIPVREIRRIDFGIHLSEGVRQRVEAAIKQLGSDTYRQRQEASKQLIELGALAYPAVNAATASSDLEVAKRAQAILKTIRDKVPGDQLRTKVDDFILTTEFPVTGRIISPALRARTAYFGDVDVRLSELRNLRLHGGSGEVDVVVDAAKYGSAPDQWFDTGFGVDVHGRLVITATGTVDLWPQTPGQYMATPKGYGQPGPTKAGRYMAASLIGRVGETGTPFLIGDRYEGTPGQEGPLFLHIVPSPWNNASTGTYQVKVSTTGAALGGR
jgi:hypothetical protein